MANILGNVFKGKDNVNGSLATQGAGQGSGNVRPANPNVVNLQTSGRPGGHTTHATSNSTAAQLARERAEAAKAQIEMRKAAEAARKEEQEADKKDITPVGLNPHLLITHSMLQSSLRKKRRLHLRASPLSVSLFRAEVRHSPHWLLHSLLH